MKLKQIIAVLLVIIFLVPTIQNAYAAGTAADIVSIAENEIGNSGSKYRKWYDGKDDGRAWCVMFISWCANEAGISQSVIKKDAGTGNMYNNLLKNGATEIKDTSKAQAGDIVIYCQKNSSGMITAFYHAAIAVNNTYSIHGNLGEKDKNTNKIANYQVRKVKTTDYNNGTNYSIVYLRPNYGGSSSKTDGTTVTTPAPVVTTSSAQNITQTNAVIYGSVSGVSTSCGFYFGTSESELTQNKSNKRKAVTFSAPNKTGYSLWCDMNKEARITLTAGTTYFYQAFAVGADGKEYYGTIEQFSAKGGTSVVPAAAPANLKANNYVSTNGATAAFTVGLGDTITLTWDSVQNATKYKVEPLSWNGSSWVVDNAYIKEVSATSTAYNNLPATTAASGWGFRVTAGNNAGWSSNNTYWYKVVVSADTTGKSVIITNAATDITTTSVRLNGTVANPGKYDIGFCWAEVYENGNAIVGAC